MAEVKYKHLVDEVHGATSKGGEIHRRKHYVIDDKGHKVAGKNEVYFRNPRDWEKTPATEGEMQSRSTFSESRKEAFAEIADPARRAYWLEEFNKQKKYVRLDCFVAAMIRKGKS